MRYLLALFLTLQLCPALCAATPPHTIDDVVDSARQQVRRPSGEAGTANEVAIEVAIVPAPQWSPALAAAGTLILLTAVAMAFTALAVELGLDLRRPQRVRIRLTPISQP